MKRRHELNKEIRREQIADVIHEDPCLTDEELAERFSVSVATIRLDRQTLGIPQMRERIAKVANRKPTAFRDELQVLDVDEGEKGVALFETTAAMLNAAGVVSADCLYGVAAGFAQILTGEIFSPLQVGNIKYKKLVTAGEQLILKGKVALMKGNKKYIYLSFYRKEMEVFRAKFIMKVWDGIQEVPCE